MSKLTFVNEENKVLYEDEKFGNTRDMEIKVTPKGIIYPISFDTFITSVRAQKKLQSTLNQDMEISFEQSEYAKIEGVDFVSMLVKITLGRDKFKKTLPLPVICPMDLETARDFISQIKAE